MLFKSYTGISKFINSIWYIEGLCEQLIFRKNTRLKSCERIYIVDFPLFIKINSSDMFA